MRSQLSLPNETAPLLKQLLTIKLQTWHLAFQAHAGTDTDHKILEFLHKLS